VAPGATVRALVLAVLACGTAPASSAQNLPATSPVLILDQEELFLLSQFGQRIRADIAAASTELGAENRRIETELVAEEQSLTDRRPGLPVDEFRALARAFDEKVTAIRAVQDAKARAINRASDEAQQAFFGRVAEVLLDIMRERGAVAILDDRMVFLSADLIDITDLAVARIDAAIGDGADP